MTDKIDRFEARVASLPLVGMGDRQFELFVWSLLEAERASTACYDKSVLLPHGRDQGRDVVLYKQDVAVGIVQCKCTKSSMTLPDVVLELAKYAMFRLRDPLDADSPEHYQLWCASNLTEPARLLFDEKAARLDSALSDLAAVVEKLRRDYRTFANPVSGHTSATEVDAVRSVIEDLNLGYRVAHHINSLADGHPNVRQLYFRGPDDGVKPVLIQEIEEAMQRRRAAQLREYETQGRAGPHPYVPDPDLDAAFEVFAASSKVGIAILAEAGRGKSTWAARMLETPLFARPICVVRGEEIAPGDEDIVASLTRLSFPGRQMELAVRTAMELWLTSIAPIIIVDGLDRARSSVREGLGDWLRQSVLRLPAQSARLVVTSRPQAWEVLALELDGTLLSGATEHRLRLEYAQTRDLYRAYGLDSDVHGLRPLRTPSMIALFARMRGELNGRATRLDLLEAAVPRYKGDIQRLATLGRTQVDAAFIALQDLLAASTDGSVDVVILSSRVGPNVIDAMIDSGLLLRSDNLVRPVLDEVLEYLLSKAIHEPSTISLTAMLELDDVHSGALALRLAALETDETLVDTILDDLLAVDGKEAVEFATRILLEQRDHGRHFGRLLIIFQAWSKANYMLLTSHLVELAANLSLPAADQLVLVMELADGEDPLDWRRKYMAGFEDESARILTPFHSMATTLVRSLGAVALPILLRHLSASLPVPDVTKGLATDAVISDVETAMPALLEWPYEARHEVMANAIARFPSKVSAVVVDLCVAGVMPLTDGVRLVSLIGAWNSNFPDIAAAASAARKLLASDLSAQDRATLLMLVLGDTFDETAADELVGLDDQIDEYSFWYCIGLLGEKAKPLIQRAVSETRDSSASYSKLSILSGSQLPIDAGMMILAEISKIPVEDPGAADRARALEGLLYSFEGEGLSDGLALALQYATSPDPAVRSPLIYYAASALRGDVFDAKAARAQRDLLLATLIDAETGENLHIYAFKLMERSASIDWNISHLERLCHRLAADIVIEAIDDRRFINPEAETIIDGLRRRLGAPN